MVSSVIVLKVQVYCGCIASNFVVDCFLHMYVCAFNLLDNISTLVSVYTPVPNSYGLRMYIYSGTSVKGHSK